MGVAGATVSRWSWAMIFFVVLVAPKAKSGRVWDRLGTKSDF